eukprot:TRINITY_DN14453_c0_g1_i1.p1 TRINITY_DN14453_c0_g1~~TRINITY_DN14453_c0_g1_i1.p1  ORF type:complete len:220 (-),score=9.82 TRINITY_DN14453_c0_g1_i1:34-693(-)
MKRQNSSKCQRGDEARSDHSSHVEGVCVHSCLHPNCTVCRGGVRWGGLRTRQDEGMCKPVAVFASMVLLNPCAADDGLAALRHALADAGLPHQGVAHRCLRLLEPGRANREGLTPLGTEARPRLMAVERAAQPIGATLVSHSSTSPPHFSPSCDFFVQTLKSKHSPRSGKTAGVFNRERHVHPASQCLSSVHGRCSDGTSAATTRRESIVVSEYGGWCE